MGSGKPADRGEEEKGRPKAKHSRGEDGKEKPRSRKRASSVDVESLRARLQEVTEEKAKALQDAKKYRDRYDAERRETKRLQRIVSHEERSSVEKGAGASSEVHEALLAERDAFRARVEALEQELTAKDTEVERVRQRCSELEKSAAAARSAAEAAKAAAEAAGASATDYGKEMERLRGVEAAYNELFEKKTRETKRTSTAFEQLKEEVLSGERPEATAPRDAPAIAELTEEKEELARQVEQGREALAKSQEQVDSLKQELETLVSMAEELDRDLQVEKKSHTQTKRSIYVLEELVEELQERQKSGHGTAASGAMHLNVGLAESASQPLISPRSRDNKSRKSKMWPFRKDKKFTPRSVSSGADSRRDMAAGPDSKHHYVPGTDNQPKPMAETQMRKELEVLVLLGEKLQEELQAERKAHADSKEMLLEQQLVIEQLQADGGGAQQEKRRRGLEVSQRLKNARKRSRAPTVPPQVRRTSEPMAQKNERSELPRDGKSAMLASSSINAPASAKTPVDTPKGELDANLREALQITRMVIASLDVAS